MTNLEIFLLIGMIASWVEIGVLVVAQVAINRLQSKVNNCQQKLNDYYEQRIDEIKCDLCRLKSCDMPAPGENLNEGKNSKEV